MNRPTSNPAWAARHSKAPQSLRQYHGKLPVVASTASDCGCTRQYEGPEAPYRMSRDRGLVVLGFPSNDYGAQAPDSRELVTALERRRAGKPPA